MNDNDKTKLVMENVHLRRKLAEAEQRLEWAKGNVSIRDSEGNIYERVVELRDAAVWRLNRELESARADRQRLMAEVAELNGKLADRVPRRMYEKAEKSAARRLRHIDGVVNAIRKRNWYIDVLKGRVKELEFNNSQLGEQLQGLIDAGRAGTRGLTDRERRILDMWPRFEDGEPVWFGDELDFGGDVQQVQEFRFMRDSIAIADEFDFEEFFEIGERVKRPASEVLDADGVLIRVGDTVYGIGRTGHEFRVLNLHDVDEELGDAFSVKCYDMDDDEKCHCRPELLTHREPDSMLRLYEDTCTGKVGMNEFADRAKALSGVE